MSVNLGGLLVGLMLSFILQHLDWRSCFLTGASITFAFGVVLFFLIHNDLSSVPSYIHNSCKPEKKTEEDTERSVEQSDDESDRELDPYENQRELDDIVDIPENHKTAAHPLDGKSALEVVVHFLKSGSFLSIIAANTAVTSVGLFIIVFVPFFLSDHLHVSPSEAALSSIFSRLAMLLGTLFGIFFYGKLGPYGELFANVGSLALSLVSIFFLWYLDSMNVMLVNFLIFLMSLGLTLPWFFPGNIFVIEFGGPEQSMSSKPTTQRLNQIPSPPNHHNQNRPTPNATKIAITQHHNSCF